MIVACPEKNAIDLSKRPHALVTTRADVKKYK